MAAKDSGLRFWVEVWRQPFLAFALMAKDPAWKVCEEDPATLVPLPGWTGPLFLRLNGLRIGVYVDDRLRVESAARIRAALLHARRSPRGETTAA
jgi:hypothetical protein